MAGLYIHIPFCRKLCYYCDFHFTVSFKNKEALLSAIMNELTVRKPEADELTFETVYFGGGTPSVLAIRELTAFFDAISKNYRVDPSAEITFEANPDDLNNAYLGDLRKYTPVNRLSIGIQSFNDRDLILLNRRHTASDAIRCVENAKAAGFMNINIDLIYGIPGMSARDLEKNLELFTGLDIPHLSAYHLTIEPKTVFGFYQKKGRLNTIDEDLSREQFNRLLDLTEKSGYEQYEISNFARPAFYSRHNLGYWSGKPYLGFGPSAHSYLEVARRWNIANNTLYTEALERNNDRYFETEVIDRRKAYNEYIMTRLRTKWGISTGYISDTFGKDYFETCYTDLREFLKQDLMFTDNDRFILNRKGKLIADYIIRELIRV